MSDANQSDKERIRSLELLVDAYADDLDTLLDTNHRLKAALRKAENERDEALYYSEELAREKGRSIESSREAWARYESLEDEFRTLASDYLQVENHNATLKQKIEELQEALYKAAYPRRVSDPTEYEQGWNDAVEEISRGQGEW